MEARRGQKAQTELCCRGLVGSDPARTPGNEGQASSVFAPAGGQPAETKKARSVVALSGDPRFFIPWRLSGLLSGYLPTDTRPQARAKLGKNANRAFGTAAQHFF